MDIVRQKLTLLSLVAYIAHPNIHNKNSVNAQRLFFY